MSSSIHIQKASDGAITHNSRENYSKSVVFTDEKNELWNDKKQAYEIYRSELTQRVEAYTKRTNQKLQKTAVTQLSAIVNLEQHHTLKDLEKIKIELEKVFDTKVYQMAIHRDEGKLKNKTSGEYLASGIDFHLNSKDNKYYFEKRVEKKVHIYEKELDINDYEIEKNYHAHIEMMGLDSDGQAIRQKMNRFVLSNLQDFTALSLNMERGKNYLVEKSSKRLDTHEFKLKKKEENEAKKEALEYKNKNMKNVIRGRELIKEEKEKVKEEKEKVKEEKEKVEALNELLKVKEKEIKRLMQEVGGFTRVDYAEVEALKKELTNAKASEEQVEKSYRSLQAKYESKSNEVTELTNELNFIKCNERDLMEELEEIKLDVYSPDYKYEDNEAIKNIDVVKYLENENKKIEESLKIVKTLKLDIEIANARMQEELECLKNQNKSLQDTNRVLEEKVTDLQEKIVPEQNMSDYGELKMMLKTALIYANSKISELRALGKSNHRASISEDEIREMMIQGEKMKSKESKSDYDYNNSNLRER